MSLHGTFPPGTQTPHEAPEVELAANSVGWAMEQVCKVSPSPEAARAIATHLYDAGLLQMPSARI